MYIRVCMYVLIVLIFILFIEMQSNLDISNSDISNYAKLEASI